MTFNIKTIRHVIYLKELLPDYEPVRQLRSSLKQLLQVHIAETVLASWVSVTVPLSIGTIYLSTLRTQQVLKAKLYTYILKYAFDLSHRVFCHVYE